MLMRWSAWVALALAIAQLGSACGDDDGGTPPDASPPRDWQVVKEDLAGALLSTWGSSEDDVWTVGGDPDTGPMVLHWNGSAWETLDPESPGDLWWVFGFDGGPVYMGGTGGRILRHSGSGFEDMQTPTSTPVVFGIWGCSQDDVWAVGGNFGGGSGGFAWHLEGGEWTAHDLPDGEDRPVWKVVGRSCDDVRFVGEGGLSFSWDGEAFTPEATGIGESLFTDTVMDDCYLAVGGLAGIILEDCGSGWQDVSPDGALGLNGVCAAGGTAYATGQFGSVYRRTADGTWIADDTPPTSQTLHGCWVDPSDGVWAVGGQVLSPPLTNGVMVYRGGQEFAAAGS
jgi:hypothetical protein